MSPTDQTTTVPERTAPGVSAVPSLLTVGHGTATREELVDLLVGAGVRTVVDVRRFPGSRRHPHVASDQLEQWLPAAGIGYRWEPRLGGRRRVPEGEGGSDPWWRVEAFRAYAAHTRTDEFRGAMAELLEELRAHPDASTAIMCSESLWWRCHRRIISDVAVLLHRQRVQHLGHDGRRTDHVPAEGARPASDGLRYDRDGADGGGGRESNPPGTDAAPLRF